MVEGIEKYQFLQGKGYGDVLTLSNTQCIIYLQNFGEGVGFSFAAVADPETKFSLGSYLDAFVAGGKIGLCPKLPKGLDFEQKFIHDLQGFNTVLTSEALAAPLSGDFTWSPKYLAFTSELEMLGRELNNLLDINEDEYMPIWRRKRDGDLTWMDDVRRILAEKESKS